MWMILEKEVGFVGRQRWPAILANRNFVNDVTSAEAGAQNHRSSWQRCGRWLVKRWRGLEVDQSEARLEPPRVTPRDRVEA